MDINTPDAAAPTFAKSLRQQLDLATLEARALRTLMFPGRRARRAGIDKRAGLRAGRSQVVAAMTHVFYREGAAIAADDGTASWVKTNGA